MITRNFLDANQPNSLGLNLGNKQSKATDVDVIDDNCDLQGWFVNVSNMETSVALR